MLHTILYSFHTFTFQYLASCFETVHIWHNQVWHLLHLEELDGPSWRGRHDDQHLLWCYCWVGVKCHCQSDWRTQSPDASLLYFPSVEKHVRVLRWCLPSRGDIRPLASMFHTFSWHLMHDLIELLIIQGVGPTAQRAAVITAVELPIYDVCKHRLIQSQLIGDTVSNHFV